MEPSDKPVPDPFKGPAEESRALARRERYRLSKSTMASYPLRSFYFHERYSPFCDLYPLSRRRGDRRLLTLAPATLSLPLRLSHDDSAARCSQRSIEEAPPTIAPRELNISFIFIYIYFFSIIVFSLHIQSTKSNAQSRREHASYLGFNSSPVADFLNQSNSLDKRDNRKDVVLFFLIIFFIFLQLPHLLSRRLRSDNRDDPRLSREESWRTRYLDVPRHCMGAAVIHSGGLKKPASHSTISERASRRSTDRQSSPSPWR